MAPSLKLARVPCGMIQKRPLYCGKAHGATPESGDGSLERGSAKPTRRIGACGGTTAFGEARGGVCGTASEEPTASILG